ncbi:BF3164 family lipoprotein [Roseivirga echinicomitans]
MKKFPPYLLLALLIILSCENRKKQPSALETDFNKNFTSEIKSLNTVKKERLEGEVIINQDSGAINIHIYDTLLLLRQLGDGDVLHVYNVESLEALGKIGTKGIGPNDFVSPRVLDQFYIKNNDLHLLIYEARKSEMRDLNITKSLKNKNTEIQTINKLHPRLGLSQFVLLASDSTYIGNQGFDVYKRDRLKKVDASSNIINTVGLYPIVEGLSSVNSYEQYQLFFDYIRKKPNENIFVSVLTRFDQIDIFDEDLKSSISVKGSQAMKQYDLTELKIGELDRFHYRDVRVDENYIYALYHDQLLEDYLEKDHECEIRVFNWEGDLIKTFIVDYLVAFAVDSKNQSFYGLDMFNERIMKYKFNL